MCILPPPKNSSKKAEAGVDREARTTTKVAAAILSILFVAAIDKFFEGKKVQIQKFNFSSRPSFIIKK